MIEELRAALRSIQRAIEIEEARSASERPAGGPFAYYLDEDRRQPTPGVHEEKTRRTIDCDDAPVSVSWQE